MTKEQVDKIFKLLSQSKPTARENIKSLYLDRLGESIIDYCVKYFETEKKADVRYDYLRFVLQYAKTDNRVIDFAEKALADKSKKVRQKALSIFAFSTNSEFLRLLESQRGKLKGNEEDIENAINAIKNHNHNLFYPAYDEWTITRADENRHLSKEQFEKDVKFYIEQCAKEAVPELKKDTWKPIQLEKYCTQQQMKFLAFLLGVLLLSCNKTTTWSCYELENDLLCLPLDWKRTETKQFVFFSDFGDSLVQTFFVLNKIKKELVESPESYLRELHKALGSDTIELTDSYKLNYLKLPNTTAYYGEFNTQYKGQEYIFMTMIWMNDKSLCDIGLKAKKENKDEFYAKFQEILFRFQTDGKNVFSRTDELEFETITFEELREKNAT